MDKNTILIFDKISDAEKQRIEEGKSNMEVMAAYQNNKYNYEKVSDFVVEKFRNECGLQDFTKTKGVQFDLQQISNIPTTFDYRLNNEKLNKIILVDVRANNTSLGSFYKDELYRKLINLKQLKDCALEPDIKLVVIFYYTSNRKHSAAKIIQDTFKKAIDNNLLDVYECKITESDEIEYDLLEK